MEHRIYFVFGDLLANTAVGALAGAAGAWFFGPEWHVAAALAAGMVIGMAVGVTAGLLIFAPLFGALEVLVPCMLSGSFSCMASAMSPASLDQAAARGALIGLACLAVVYVVSAVLHGERKAPQ
jgi:hypothetical protein